MRLRPHILLQEPESGSGAPPDNITPIARAKPGPKPRADVVQECAERFNRVLDDLVNENLYAHLRIRPGTREATESLWQSQGILSALTNLGQRTGEIFRQE